jgi:hypothetical protein
VAWVAEGSEQWPRNIPGIDGTLTATQKGHGNTGEQPVLLLHDLSGNVVAGAADNETETKLLHKYNSTEFGTPTGKEAPPKYSWLGAGGIANELPAGPITQDGVTYVPQFGATLQAQNPQLPAHTLGGNMLARRIPGGCRERQGRSTAHPAPRTPARDNRPVTRTAPPSARLPHGGDRP